MSLDQLQKGMKTFGLLSEMEKHPSLFERVFNQVEKELTPNNLKDLLLFPQQQEPTQGMLVKFLDESPQQRLQNFLKFCAGCKDLLPLHNKKIEVEFHDQSYIFSSTCSFKLQLPKTFSAYTVFEMALLAVMQDSGKPFTTT